MDWPVTINIESLPADGKTVMIETNEEQRQAIAARLAVPSVDQLSARITLHALDRGMEVSGQLDALLARICVSTLQPMEEQISEDISVKFSRDAGDLPEDSEISLDDMTVEHLETEEFDLSEYLVQCLALAMAPYPRIEGADGLVEDFGKSGESSPFSVLKSVFEEPPEKLSE